MHIDRFLSTIFKIIKKKTPSFFPGIPVLEKWTSKFQDHCKSCVYWSKASSKDANQNTKMPFEKSGVNEAYVGKFTIKIIAKRK